jgi:hypothetical protein
MLSVYPLNIIAVAASALKISAVFSVSMYLCLGNFFSVMEDGMEEDGFIRWTAVLA